jgi:DNA-binding NtrC family response regulator
MKKKIVVMNADENECQELCAVLEKQHYPTISLHSLADVEICLKEEACIAAILDIDTVPVDNRTIRELTINNPDTYFFCLSEHRFHPELKDAICYHIYACITKPIDLDELFYWIGSIYEENNADC